MPLGLILVCYFLTSTWDITDLLAGMAVRSAYALGLHRKQLASIFTPTEQRVR